MPWKERSAVAERVSFILEWQAGQSSVAELCRSFGISRRWDIATFTASGRKDWRGFSHEAVHPDRHGIAQRPTWSKRSWPSAKRRSATVR